MAALFTELLIVSLMVFALTTLVRSYTGRKRRIKELEKELSWYRQAAMVRNLASYPDDIMK
ncbi:hypothetical protein J3T99_08550 [Acetobacteraceae bacterium B3987]|nr:hypothetical protein [Acetobacteraceae bacterium B3987]